MKDRINEMFNGNFTTPQILKRCEDAGFIKEIKGRSFDNCTELVELMQSKFEDLAEELPLSCFLNAAAALFNNGVVHGTSESGKIVFVESKENKKMKGRRFVEANSGFKPLRELLDSLVDPEDYADFLEYASDYGYDFEYEDPNAVWPVAEIQELVDCYYNDEDFGGYFGDPELHIEYDDETGDINLDMAYSDWIKSYAPNYDVSNEDAWQAGVELAGGVYDEASGQKYSEWVESFAPNYDIPNEDAFTAGFKSIVEDPEITCFESATPYKERGVSYERRGR